MQVGWRARLARIMVRKLDQGLTATVVAAEFGWSAGHLHRKLISETGMTFGELHTRLRVRRAARLLRGGTTVDEAAASVGYADARGLQRAFKRSGLAAPAHFKGGASSRGAQRALP